MTALVAQKNSIVINSPHRTAILIEYAPGAGEFRIQLHDDFHHHGRVGAMTHLHLADLTGEFHPPRGRVLLLDVVPTRVLLCPGGVPVEQRHDHLHAVIISMQRSEDAVGIRDERDVLRSPRRINLRVRLRHLGVPKVVLNQPLRIRPRDPHPPIGRGPLTTVKTAHDSTPRPVIFLDR